MYNDQRLTLEYSMLLNQSQIQSLELLELNNIELQSLLENEYLENPMFEYTGSKFGAIREERFSDMMDIPVYDRQEAGTLIKDQLNMKTYTESERRVTEAIIMCMDSNGYFTESRSGFAELLGVDTELVTRCLDRLKELEPAGIFAADLEECLLIQVERLGIHDEILKMIIRNHLQDISKGKISAITRALKIHSVQARKYIEFIGKLNPIPLAGVGKPGKEYIVPDVICKREAGKWNIHINDGWYGNYEINDYYVRMYQKAEDEELKQYFKKKYERARFLVNSIEQRRRTLLKVAGRILERQSDYFLNKGGLKPLRMEDVAQDLNIHVSTVSRAVSGKYMEYYGGTVALRDMFAVGVGKGNEVVTAARIKEVIRKLLERERREMPFSDQRISEELKKEGIQLSRRGVAKYRQEMGIPSSLDRQEKE